MKSFSQYLKSGSAQSPMDFQSAVTARAFLNDITVHFHRRMRTKTPLWIWSMYVDKGDAPVSDVDSGGAVGVSGRNDVIKVLSSFVHSTPVTALCIPAGCSLHNVSVSGFRCQTANNGDLWLVQNNVTPAAFDDYLSWDYGKR